MLIRTVKNFQEWRNIARQLLMANVPPHQVTWTEISDKQNTLFVESEPAAKPIQTQAFKISKDFLALAELVSLHANKERWSLLYEAVWRLTHGEKYLLSISSDILVNQLLLFKKAVERDAHKMKAFVRFRCYRDNDKEYYVAWYQPDHHVVRFVSAFFKKDFPS